MGKVSTAILLEDFHGAQGEKGYLTEEDISVLAGAHNLQPSQVYGTASFYSMLSFSPRAPHVITACKNAPCHVSGAEAVIAALEKSLGTAMGGTTRDGRIALQYTECVGQCQAGPTIIVDGEVHSGLKPEQIDGIVAGLQ